MTNRLRRPLFALALALAGLAVAPAAWPGEGLAGSTERKRPLSIVEREAAPPSPGERAARLAVEAVGTPYRYGGESPATGFDCSGLVRWSYGRVGIDLPHSSYALAREGRGVARDALQPGDVLLFAGLGHVGLYLGDGRMVHAPQTGRHVEVVRLARRGYGDRLVGARRVAAV